MFIKQLLYIILVCMLLVILIFSYSLYKNFNLANHSVLSIDEAFKLEVNPINQNTIRVHWKIAPGYYLYRDSCQINVIDNSIRVTQSVEQSQEIQDLYYHTATIKLLLSDSKTNDITLKVHYQGCSIDGICYPPVDRLINVHLLENSIITVPYFSAEYSTSEDYITKLLIQKRFLAVPIFLAFGLLLSFTPCVFPVMPIISRVILRQLNLLKKQITLLDTILLSITYVLSMAISQTIIGLLIVIIGVNIHLWINGNIFIIICSLLYVLTALSIFGFYKLQLPDCLQNLITKCNNYSREYSNSYINVIITGGISAIFASPCITPPFVGSLTFISVTGDFLLGSLALFSLSIGMGIPIIIFSTSANKFISINHYWLGEINLLLGNIFLFLALLLIEQLMPNRIRLLLWAIFFIYLGIMYSGKLSLISKNYLRDIIRNCIGILSLIYGCLLISMLYNNYNNIWQLFNNTNKSNLYQTEELIQQPFITINSLEELSKLLTSACGKPIIIDFYAQWCISCKLMEQIILSDQVVKDLIKNNYLALRIDLTTMNNEKETILKHFRVFGPPTLIFIRDNYYEYHDCRIVGFTKSDKLIKCLKLISNH